MVSKVVPGGLLQLVRLRMLDYEWSQTMHGCML